MKTTLCTENDTQHHKTRWDVQMKEVEEPHASQIREAQNQMNYQIVMCKNFSAGLHPSTAENGATAAPEFVKKALSGAECELFSVALINQMFRSVNHVIQCIFASY
jgi:uncharacterized protein (UPF0276 family)